MSAQGPPETTRHSPRGVLLAAAIAILAGSIAGCAKPRVTVERQVLAGPFHGETDDGRAVQMTFSEDRQAFSGQGTIGTEPIVVAGAVGWRGVGTLAGGGGGADLVEVTLSSDGETVLLERTGQPPVTLQRGGSATPPGAAGPFSGSYRAQKERATLARVTLVQSGALLAGVGTLAGDPAGITGRATGPRTAEGLVTFQDGSQIRFRAELAADGDALTVSGFGEPISMTRGGSR